MEEERVKAVDLPGPAKGAFWGKDVFAHCSNLDRNTSHYKTLLAQWNRLKKSARLKVCDQADTTLTAVQSPSPLAGV